MNERKSQLAGDNPLLRLSFAILPIMYNRKHNGFTIVELLVVILVISILATVSVTAYNGVQQRAGNSAVLAAVSSTAKAIRMHYDSAGTPLKAAFPGWFHESLSTMGGVCIGKTWPSQAELQAATGYANEQTARSVYCGWYSNSSISVEDAQQRLDANIDSSPTKDAFTKIPSFPPITLNVTGGGTYTIRGIRYAFNNSATNPTSYIHYPYNGKQCAVGDDSVRLTDTFWPSAGGGEWPGPFTTGGDYTTNNTVSCIRTVRYQ